MDKFSGDRSLCPKCSNPLQIPGLDGGFCQSHGWVELRPVNERVNSKK